MQRRFMVNGKVIGGGCSIERVNLNVLNKPANSISSYVDYRPDPIVKRIEIEFGEPNYAIKKYITESGKFERVALWCRYSSDNWMFCGLYNPGWWFTGISGYTSLAPVKCTIKANDTDSNYNIIMVDESENEYLSSMTREKFLSIESFNDLSFDFNDINFQSGDKYEDYVLFPNMVITYYLQDD